MYQKIKVRKNIYFLKTQQMESPGIPFTLTNFLVISGLAASTISAVLYFLVDNDPYKTKPIPTKEQFLADVTAKAREDAKIVYKVTVKPCGDIDCPYDELVGKNIKYPTRVTGNLYCAVLKLHEFLLAETNGEFDYLDCLYNETVYDWNPKTETFLKAFRRFASARNCLYLSKEITL